MKVLLINPPMPYGIKGHLQTPLGLCYLSSMIMNIAETMVFDCNVSANLEKTILSFSPDIIGISILTPTYKNSIKLLNHLKNLVKKNCFFIAGGVHASLFPEEILKKGFNIVIRGEGEQVFYNVILSLAKGEHYHMLDGVSYIDYKGNIVHNREAKRIENLDSIPFPDRKDLPLSCYEHESIITSRGCCFRCFYCSSSHYWGQKIRYRSASNVFDELSQLYKAGIKNFYFCDDNFTSSKTLVCDICNRIISSNMNIKWTALTRVDTIDSSLLKLMKKAGCTILSLGIESGSNVFHRDVKKTSIETIKCAFEMIKQADIKTRTTWIIGLGKTYDDEYQSLQLIKDLLPDQVSVHCLIPFPNTEAWNEPEKYNIVIDKNNFDWDVMNMTFSPNLLDYVQFTHISKKQIIALIETTRTELVKYGYDGKNRKFESFLDNTIIKVID